MNKEHLSEEFGEVKDSDYIDYLESRLVKAELQRNRAEVLLHLYSDKCKNIHTSPCTNCDLFDEWFEDIIEDIQNEKAEG